jgi:transposase
VHLSHQGVREVCHGHATCPAAATGAIERKPRLTNAHTDYLTSQATVDAWAGYSLDERASLFMKQFPGQPMTGGRLWHLYHRQGIRFKVVKSVKEAPPHRAVLIPAQCRAALAELRRAQAEDRKIIWIDEVMFTKHTNMKSDWNARYRNTVVTQKKSFIFYRAVIAGLSLERGIEAIQLQYSGVDQHDVCTFLEELGKRNRGKRLAIYCDQLTAHKTNRVKTLMERRGQRCILAPIYSPEANPIEFAFAKVKRLYKKRKLEALNSGEDLDPDAYIRDAFNSITCYNAQNYVGKSRRYLELTS